jgi:hypothetical protein
MLKDQSGLTGCGKTLRMKGTGFKQAAEKVLLEPASQPAAAKASLILK